MSQQSQPYSLVEGPDPIPDNHVWMDLKVSGNIAIYDENNPEDAWIKSDTRETGVTIR